MTTPETAAPTAFDPVDVGPHHLRNRIAMAPLTRNRADEPGALANARMAEYYAQRAGAGLIVSEGTHPAVVGQSYPHEPGIATAAQADAWRRVTDAVHARGGTIFCQLMHGGRISHPDVLPDGLWPLAPSPVTAPGTTFTPTGQQPFAVPREMTEDDIAEAIASFATAARHAMDAGFDGVEIHGANGYLVHQFLSGNVNLRTDRWGGSAENRRRFALEVARVVVDAIGAQNVGIRLAPGGRANAIEDAPDLAETYLPLVRELGDMGLVYLHVMESDRELTGTLREVWPRTFLLSPYGFGELTGPEHLELVADGTTDLLAFGRRFIANPDLVERLAQGGPFTEPDESTFYGGDERGYTDYPTL